MEYIPLLKITAVTSNSDDGYAISVVLSALVGGCILQSPFAASPAAEPPQLAEVEVAARPLT